MSREEQTYHLIDRYLQGDLTGRELDEFKAKLKDPSFQQLVHQQEELINAIKEVRRSELRALMTESQKVKYIQNMWGKSWTYASAAIVALFVSAFFVIKYFASNESQLAMEPSEEVAEDNQISGDTNIQQTEVDSQTLAIETAPPSPMIELVEEDEEYAEDMEASPELDTVDPLIEDNAGLADAAPDSEIPSVDKARAASNRDEVVRKDEFLTGKHVSLQSGSIEYITRPDSVLGFVEEAGSESAKDFNVIKGNTSSMYVEYWESVVNFRGYQFEDGKLEVYGLDPEKPLKLLQMDDRLYLRSEGTYYFINKKSAYSKFVPVTNGGVLDALKQLDE